MKIIAELSVIPLGVGLSLSDYIAECERVLKNKGLKIELHAEGTDIEGELNTVLSGVESCIKAVHKLGAPRVMTNLKISSRMDKEESIKGRVESVEEKI